MPRNCLIAIVVLIVLFLGYSFYFYNAELPFERALLGGGIMAFVVMLGLAMINGSRYTGRDRRALERFRRGERPRDGEVVAVEGEIRPALEALHAPFSRDECVVYKYDIGPPRAGQSSARDYVGFAFARCAIHTPYGTYAVGSFPVLHGFPERREDPDRAREWVAVTEFEEITNVLSFAKYTLALHQQPPPLRIDWRYGAPSGDTDDAKETMVPSGAAVTAYGRYSAAGNALVSGRKNEGYLRLYAGKGASAPSSGTGQLIAGIVLLILAHAGMWLVLRNMPSL